MAKGIDEYLQTLPEHTRKALQNLRETVRQILPDATETISTNVPAFHYKGKYLVSFSAAKNHLALLVMQGEAMRHFADELKPYNTGSRIIRFTPERPLPRDLIEKIVRFRQAEIDTK